MHRASITLVFALFFASMAAAAPVTSVSAIVSSSSASDVVIQSSGTANIALPLEDILPAAIVHDQSEYAHFLPDCIALTYILIRTYSHAPESVHSAEKSRRRSFRRYVVFTCQSMEYI